MGLPVVGPIIEATADLGKTLSLKETWQECFHCLSGEICRRNLNHWRFNNYTGKGMSLCKMPGSLPSCNDRPSFNKKYFIFNYVYICAWELCTCVLQVPMEFRRGDQMTRSESLWATVTWVLYLPLTNESSIQLPYIWIHTHTHIHTATTAVLHSYPVFLEEMRGRNDSTVSQ